ncbi:hypothetical protein HYC85_029775 [Camellia sinensis]|uniref:Uncharacterized protein n=1 Tax=Camellia sinensis TaxID=4442 RepID=A0A7J7G2S5_CAMSI|nr:hypothetical protein HYC85_029775 [Camellia sinensis]
MNNINVVGASAIRPCNLVFGADQFNPKAESGKRAISSFFNWYYFTFTFAMMVSLTSNVNWALGLAIPTFLMFLSCVVFFIGTRIYVMVVPHGSPLTSVVQVIVAAIKKRKVALTEQSFFFYRQKRDFIDVRIKYMSHLFDATWLHTIGPMQPHNCLPHA